MLRPLLISLAVFTAGVAIVSCASDEDRRTEAAVRATCLIKDSPADDPEYDRACIRRVEEQIQAAKTYRPSSRPPKGKGK